jgi:anti-sigma regulatory factor (Ser/Thr protein kinase)
VLLEITPIRSHEDVHGVIDHVQERAGAILATKLGYSRADAAMFSMILSEVCQNIIEHAESGGWVGIQSYNWAKRLGRNVVIIAVHDLGIGFRGSLAKEHSARFGDRWSDATALEAAFIHGVTRFRDPGRGQGLKQIRNRVGRWGGKHRDPQRYRTHRRHPGLGRRAADGAGARTRSRLPDRDHPAGTRDVKRA